MEKARRHVSPLPFVGGNPPRMKACRGFPQLRTLSRPGQFGEVHGLYRLDLIRNAISSLLDFGVGSVDLCLWRDDVVCGVDKHRPVVPGPMRECAATDRTR